VAEDEIADSVVRNAAGLGVERIICRRTVWIAIGVGSWSLEYRGPHPDHLHVEVS
jgi:hypothetical protein